MKSSVTYHIPKLSAFNRKNETEETFNLLVGLMRKHATSLEVKVKTKTHFELWTTREALMKNFKRKRGLLFISLIINQEFVGFYFQPLYFDHSLAAEIPQGLLSFRKGLTSFHFNALTASQLLEVELLIILGLSFYKKQNWL
jgi:hypothetical protein